MERIASMTDLDKIVDNRVVGDFTMSKSSILFKGKNNIFATNGNVNLTGCNIEFRGNDSLLYLNDSKHGYSLKCLIHSDSAVCFGKGCIINGVLSILAGERQHVIIGNGVMFSTSVRMENSDGHIIFDGTTKRRTNEAKSIFVGDHVWIGRDATLLKGTKIGSGSIVGTNATIVGKKIPSNVVCVGGGRVIKRNVFWYGHTTYSDTETTTQKWSSLESNEFLYEKVENETIHIDELLEKLSESVAAIHYARLIQMQSKCR